MTLEGVLNIYKEKGYTSHDVVAKLRGILEQKKIGHTGTLDPDAVGVLPVCLGKGTKLCDMLTDQSKTYEAVLFLGVETDTQDMSGKIIEEKGWVQISDEGAIQEVVNKILQANPQSIADYRAGKDRALGFLVGQAMKETKGKANPQLLNKLFIEELKK